jgi:hypothetical protein
MFGINVVYSYKIRNVPCLLNTRIVGPEKRLLLCNSYITSNNAVTLGRGVFYAIRADICHATIEKLLGEVFSAWSVPRLYNADQMPLAEIKF